jgi:formylglycine-generating enzyme required for sulfatase activity
LAAQGSSDKHVFISYDRDDQPYARGLASSLRERGFEIWMDDRIDFGDRWWREIVKAVRASAAFVVVMTPDSEESEWVEREILLAQDERKPIFPVLLRGKVNPLLISRQYADVTDGRMPPDGFYRRLGRAAPTKPKVETRPAERPAQPAPEPEVVSPPVVEPSPPVEPELIRIPAGEFLMGSDPEKDKDARDNEQPQHRLRLPDYSIAKTPVTNAQYLAFVEATGQKPPSTWEGGKPLKGKGEHPVVRVDWYDAVAYCGWLAEATGRAYRLPSEAEWEKAARGTDGRIYPWGDEWDPKRCNSREGGRDDTTPVGQYSPGGDSPYGCVDMAGNVWEWTRSLWGTDWEKLDFKYPYDPEDGREVLEAGDDIHRVLRGGAFGYYEGLVRCASRWLEPYYGYWFFGFRVVVAPGL